MKATTAIAAAAFAVGIGVGVAALAWLDHRGPPASPSHPVWTEVPWPFRVDEWGRGTAFVCKAADCGTEVTLYLRAKMGFCNKDTGVADDEELQRLSDLKLVGDNLPALSEGRPISVHWMKGRSRPHSMPPFHRAPRSALSVAFNQRNDAIVATVVVGHDSPASVESAVIAFLNGDTVKRWVQTTFRLPDETGST